MVVHELGNIEPALQRPCIRQADNRQHYPDDEPKNVNTLH